MALSESHKNVSGDNDNLRTTILHISINIIKLNNLLDKYDVSKVKILVKILIIRSHIVVNRCINCLLLFFIDKSSRLINSRIPLYLVRVNRISFLNRRGEFHWEQSDEGRREEFEPD